MSLVWEKPCQQFHIDAIRKATDNFDESKIIGKGGFGNVYKGVIDDGPTTIVVAVKRLNQGKREFETEIELFSKFRHCHLVCLVGYCHYHQEMILVYEYMSHGTLADHLYNNPDSSLTWEQRLKICIGAARGLDYLHTSTRQYSDLGVKSANIFLDENWAAKIADLGSSRARLENQRHSAIVADRERGIGGYIDPRYIRSNIPAKAADVYAFGVVLLEVLSGTSATGGKIIPHPFKMTRLHWIQQHITNNTLNQIIDPRVVRQIEPRCLKIFAYTAGLCFHYNLKKRPSMSELVIELESALACQKDTNPSSSMSTGDALLHANNVLVDNEDGDIWATLLSAPQTSSGQYDDYYD